MQWRVAVPLVAAVALGGLYGWYAQRAAAPLHGTAASSPIVPGRCGPASIRTPHPGMVWVSGGEFTLGAEGTFPEEGPAAPARVEGFWMDQTEVTNAQFAEFVAATGYRTLAERGIRLGDAPDAPVVAGSPVFRPRGEGEAMRSLVNWWQFMPGANWRHPEGPASSIEDRMQHPVVHVAYEDALAYANWKGRALPTEEQFEFAAKSSARRDTDHHWGANTWQGSFPSRDTADDGYAGTAPVACYGGNAFGLHDMVGNVWEWTTSPYFDRHDSADRARHPEGFDPTQPAERAVAVLKGGSYLCSPDYCMRYRAEARIGQSKGLGAAHIGFRTVLAGP